MEQNKELVNYQDKYGKTPLIVYSEKGLLKCIEVLFNYSVNITFIDSYGDTFLHKICKKGNTELLKKLGKYVFNNNENIIDVKNNEELTPIMICAKNGNEDMFYILKGHNANLKLYDSHDNSVFHYICYNKICIGLIVDNKPNKYGLTPKDYCRLSLDYYYFNG